MSSTTPSTTEYVLRKKRGRTVVTQPLDEYMWIDHVFDGWGHYRKAKRWLKKNGLDWYEL